MANIVVTGCAGFIGSNLCKKLIDDGHTVFGIDNFYNGSYKNMTSFQHNPRFHFFCNHIDYEILEDFLSIKGVDYVYHLAAVGSVPRSIINPKLTFQNNTVATHEMLLLARRWKVKKFFFSSSSSVYGPNFGEVLLEGFKHNPINPYAWSKSMCENLCSMFQKTFGVPTYTFRFFNVFGPNQRWKDTYSAVVPNLCFSLIYDKPFKLHGNGSQTRDFTYVGDVVEILSDAMETEMEFDLYNLCAGQPFSLNEMIRFFEEASGKTLMIETTESRKGDILNSMGSSKRLEGTFKKKPDLQQEFIAKTFNHYKELSNARND